MTDIDMIMAAVLVIGLLGSLVLYLWQDWHKNTREFREIHRRLQQIQEERRRRNEEDQR